MLPYSVSKSDLNVEAPTLSDPAAVLERRIQRERAARKEAERLLTEKSVELYEALQLGARDRHKLELALWAGNESIWDWDAEHQIYELQGFPEDAANATRSWGNTGQVIRRVHPDDQETLRTNWHLLLSDSINTLDIVVRYRPPSCPTRIQSREDAIALAQSPHPDSHKNNQSIDNPESWCWLHCRGRVVEHDKEGFPSRITGTVRDVTNHHHMQESFRLMARAFSSTLDAMLIIDHHGSIIEANQAFYSLFRLTEGSVGQRSLNDFICADEVADRSPAAQGNQTFRSTMHADFMPALPLEVSLSHFQPDDARYHYSIVTLRDMSERKRADCALQHMTQHDSLTNLANRGTLNEVVTSMLQQVTTQQPLRVMFLDLDGFKAVNDEFGHIAADVLLVTQAHRMQRLAPADGLVSRWGGDEFVIAWWPPVNQPASLPTAIMDAIREPIDLGGSSIRLSASIGIAETCQPGTDAAELIRHADTAMFEAKVQGKNRIQAYTDGLGQQTSHRASLMSELAQAIEQDQLTFYVQPKFNTERRIIGGEMLARWHSATSGNISPAVFIPLIEQGGLNASFAEAVLRHGCQYAAAVTAINPELHIAINLSGWQLLDSHLADKLVIQCQQAGVNPSRVELEITESVFMQPESDPAAIMHRLRSLGFRLAIDDFGTGYSSLSYLRDLPLDTVKIDRSFIIDADANDRALKILKAIIQMSHDLDMHIVAEGVETVEQWQLLKNLNVELYQGFLFGRPMPFEDFLQALHADMANH